MFLKRNGSKTPSLRQAARANRANQAEQQNQAEARKSGQVRSVRMGRSGGPVEADMPIGNLARYMAWVFLLLIVGLSIFLSIMISNNARQVLLNKQYEFAALLSDNLNHQIYRRFTLPTLAGFGRIALRQPAQYERLDALVRQIIHGMNVQDLKIFDHSDIVSYSIITENIGRNDLSTPEVKAAITATEPIFRLDGKLSMFSAFFKLHVEPGSFILRTTAPLRIENRLNSSEDEGPIMGVLEMTQDITADMIIVVQFQRSIIAIILVSSLLIFLIMVFFLSRAEKALAARVTEKERLLLQLHQHEKLAGMGRVIAGIAHEIRNPLGIICSSAQLLLQRTKETDKSSAGILQAIYDESRRLSQTVTDFLDYAKPKEPRQDQVDVMAVLEQALTFLGPELDKHQVLLETHFPERSPLPTSLPPSRGSGWLVGAESASPAQEKYAGGNYIVTGDKDLLYRAFYNVLINAVQAVSECRERKIRLAVGLARPAEYPQGALEVIVADSGPGFGSTDLNRFLDPFYTTKPLGSGLGLPIVSSIITSHGGMLKIMNQAPDSSGQSAGAVVRIVLPLGKPN